MRKEIRDVTLKKLTKSQLMVYKLLRILGGRTSTMEIIGLAKKRHPDLPLHAHIREQLDKLEANRYVSLDKSRWDGS